MTTLVAAKEDTEKEKKNKTQKKHQNVSESGAQGDLPNMCNLGLIKKYPHTLG